MSYEPFETYTLDGCKVEYFYDEDDSPPWEREDGHGPVRFCHLLYHKARGERILHQDRHTIWLYDWQAACKKARQEGWDALPYGEPGKIERAVQADFDHLQAYLKENWQYIGVKVSLNDQEESLWGVEYDPYADYAKTIAQELADGLNRQAQKEAAEAFYWACRDVATA